MSTMDLRRGERLLLTGAFLSLLGIVASQMLLKTARDALFLAGLPASRLPLAYLGIALGAFVMGNVATMLVWRFGRRNALVVLMLAASAVSVCIWAAFAPGRSWLYYVLYIWTGLAGTTITVAFWLLASEVFTVAQGKRLFGWVGAGASLGAVIGAATAGLWAQNRPVDQLLLIAAAMQLSFGLAPLLLPRMSALGCLFCPTRSTASLAAAVRTVAAHPYLLRVSVLVGLTAATLMLVDFQFKLGAAAAVPADRLGVFFGAVYAILGLLSLLVQVVAAGPMVRKLGVTAALGVLPLLLVGGGVALAAVGGLAVAMTLKGVDGSLRHSLHRTGVELLYMPITVELRDRVKAFVDGTVSRVSQALVSALLLVLGALGLAEPRLMGGLVVVGAAVWLWVTVSLRAPYLDLFRRTLSSGRIDTRLRFPELDVTSLEALLSALNSADDSEVTAALDMLASQNKHRLVPGLILHHSSPAVLVKALGVLGRSGRKDFVALADKLLQHDAAEVRAAAVRAKLGVETIGSEIRELLADPSPEVGALAAVALNDRELVERMATGPPEARAALLEACDDPELIGRLAHTSHPEVLAAAARAIRRARHEQLLPLLVSGLVVGGARNEVREALVAFGDKALETLAIALAAPDTPLAVRRHLPRTIARFRSSRAAAILHQHLQGQEDGVVRYKILRGLGRLLADDPDLNLDSRPVVDAALETARRLHLYRAWRSLLKREQSAEPRLETDTGRLLVSILDDKLRLGLERLFRLLALLQPRERLIDVYGAVTEGDSKARAAGLELLSGLLRPELLEWVLLLVDEPDHPSSLERSADLLGRLPQSYEEVLGEMLGAGDETLATLTAHHVAELGARELEPRVASVQGGSQSVQDVLHGTLELLRGTQG